MALASALMLAPDSGITGMLYKQSAAVSDLTSRTEIMMRNTLRLYSVGDEEVGAPSKAGVHAQAPGVPKPDVAKTPTDVNQDRQQPKDTATAAPTAAVVNIQLPPDSEGNNFTVPSPAPASAAQPVELQASQHRASTFPPAAGAAAAAVVGSPKQAANVPDQRNVQPDFGSAMDHLNLAVAAADRQEARDVRPQGKSAAAEVLQLCQRQGIPLKLPELHMQPQHRGPDFVPVSNAGLPTAPGMSAGASNALPAVSSAVAPPRTYHDQILGNGLETPARGTFTTDVLGMQPALGMVQEEDLPLPVEQQLAAALADRARLMSALHNIQATCVRKDEQMLDMQQREDLLQQQHLQLQSMYQGLLDQLQREQQQWASDCSQLQGELRTKQNVEELTKLLTNQLRQEQRQKKNVMAQLQAESSARQQLQDQLGATRMQLKNLQANTESLQWLQTTRNKLQSDLGMANAHLQMERQRNSDISMQLQNVLAAKQQLEQEVAAMRMQLQQRMQGPMDGAAGGAARPGDATRNTVTFSQAQYMGGYAEPLGSDLQFQRMNTTMAAVQLPGSPTTYMMQPTVSMAMTMHDPSGFSSMAQHQY